MATRHNKKTTSLGRLQNEVTKLKRQLLVSERHRFETIKNSKDLTQVQTSSDIPLLAAGVAHEFNNILGALSGFADWALESKKKEDMKEALEHVSIACQRASQITKALQGLAQPKEEEKKNFSSDELKKELEEHFALLVKTKDLAFDWESVTLFASYLQIFEILVNLIKNASEASEGRRPVKIRVKASSLKGQFKISVQDDGDGISELLRSKLFHPFFTTKGVMKHAQNVKMMTNSSNQAGSGLGLYLSKRLALENGGDLSCLPSEKGALFVLELPLLPKN